MFPVTVASGRVSNSKYWEILSRLTMQIGKRVNRMESIALTVNLLKNK